MEKFITIDPNPITQGQMHSTGINGLLNYFLIIFVGYYIHDFNNLKLSPMILSFKNRQMIGGEITRTISMTRSVNFLNEFNQPFKCTLVITLIW